MKGNTFSLNDAIVTYNGKPVGVSQDIDINYDGSNKYIEFTSFPQEINVTIKLSWFQAWRIRRKLKKIMRSVYY